MFEPTIPDGSHYLELARGAGNNLRTPVKAQLTSSSSLAEKDRRGPVPVAFVEVPGSFWTVRRPSTRAKHLAVRTDNFAQAAPGQPFDRVVMGTADRCDGKQHSKQNDRS
jgi:hypothetical protein